MDGNIFTAKVPLSWKKSFSMAVVIPHTKRNCVECIKDSLCDNCDKLVKQRKDFSANLYELKRKSPNEFGQMLPCYKENYYYCMVAKVKEKFEKTRHIKIIDKNKKYILRGKRDTRYHDRILFKKHNFIISHNFVI